MKINIDVDITPEEFRTLMGWPDVQSLQNDIFQKIREKMNVDAEGYDPLSLMAPYFAQSVGALDAFQKMMGGVMHAYTDGSRKKDAAK
ncbi:MAG: hypothetical protein KDI63_01670 [Gammaproteobacteria bacterium]|nr:hypothetical protein [Gammaproteobacteria bacterium]